MKYHLALLLSVLPLLPAAPARAGLTEGEKAIVSKCYGNIDTEKKIYSPAVAAECLEKFALKNKGSLTARVVAEDEQTAADIINYNSALKDLGDIIGRQNGTDIVVSFSRVLEAEDSSLYRLGLGYAPEKLFGWVDEYYPGKGAEVRRAVRTWEVLGSVRQASLSSGYSWSMEKWNKQLILHRYRTLHKWAVKETDTLVRVPAKAADKGKTEVLAQLLLEDLLTSDSALKLKAYLATLGVAEPKKPGVLMKGAERLKSEMNRMGMDVSSLKGRSASAQAGYLSGVFDNAAGGSGEGMSSLVLGGAAPAPAAQRLTDAQIKDLSGVIIPQIKKAIAGSPPGDEINKFYADTGKYRNAGLNAMAFNFEPLRWEAGSKQYGGYSPTTQKIRINSEIVNDWMTKRGVTPDQLFANNGNNRYMADLGIFISPTFVHESKHYKDHSDAILAGAATVDLGPGRKKSLPYDVSAEGRAFGYDSALSLHYLSKYGPGFMEKLDEVDRNNAAKLLEGGYQGLQDSVHRSSYLQLNSLDGQAAKEFQSARKMQSELLKLEAVYKAGPSALSAEELARMKAARAEMDGKYKWFLYMAEKNREEEKKINEWRNIYKAKLFAASKSLKTNAPEELLP